MSRIANSADSFCESSDHEVNSYNIAYNQMDGILLLSSSTLIFMTATESYEMHYHVHVKVPYQNISHVHRETPHCLVIISADGQAYRFTSSNRVTMSEIEEGVRTH